jgi:hypothetical protein
VTAVTQALSNDPGGDDHCFLVESVAMAENTAWRFGYRLATPVNRKFVAFGGTLTATTFLISRLFEV